MPNLLNEPHETCQRQEEKQFLDYSQKDYREFWIGEDKLFLHRVESNILKKIMPSDPGWFIELGSGYGRLLPLYWKPDRKIVLLDYAINLLEMAAQSYPYENVFFVAGNAYCLPFRDESFVGGISVRTFHHIKAPQAFLTELSRVMQPKGTVILEYANKRNIIRFLRYGLTFARHDHEEIKKLLFMTHPTYFNELAQRAGFKTLRNLGTGFFERILALFPYLELPVTICETIADHIFGPMKLAPLTFVEIHKPAGTYLSVDKDQPQGDLLDILICPACRGAISENGDNGFKCRNCSRFFPKNGRVIDLRFQGEDK